MVVKLNLIAAACENNGTGKNYELPWRLRSEIVYFTRMTSDTKDISKKNVVIMGRKSWDHILPKFKPLSNRINFVLSRSKLDLSDYKNTYAFTSLEQALDTLEDANLKQQYENVWVIGGNDIFELALKSKYFHRLYFTRILKYYDCDSFFPQFNGNLVRISDSKVPEDVQVENGLQFVYHVYENPQFNK